MPGQAGGVDSTNHSIPHITRNIQIVSQQGEAGEADLGRADEQLRDGRQEHRQQGDWGHRREEKGGQVRLVRGCLPPVPAQYLGSDAVPQADLGRG